MSRDCTEPSGPTDVVEPGRYQTAYQEQQAEYQSGLEPEAEAGAAKPAALGEYAQMVEFSRHRREVGWQAHYNDPF